LHIQRGQFITELPYQVNKAALIERIAELVKEEEIQGISDIRDESNKEGIRVVIEVKKGENGEVLLNHLYKRTRLPAAIQSDPALVPIFRLTSVNVRRGWQ
jgi:DNA gyrase/topoisomerase IV subunit A